MGFAEVLSRAQAGLIAPQVRVEVHIGSGLPTFTIVGLPAPAVKESRERVRAALACCGYEVPAGRITVNLSPADLPKEGGRFDLPIALGILFASGQLQSVFDLARTEFYGELGLTGELKGVPGLLLAALHAAGCGHALVVPQCGVGDLMPVQTAQLFGLGHLRELATAQPLSTLACKPSQEVPTSYEHPPELDDVRGQWQAKRALLLAAAGGHSLLMEGPPGSGKTMLAQRLPGLLPLLPQSEALEVAAIMAVAQLRPGVSGAVSGLSAVPPFRSPHHTASAHAIVGGGTAIQPGEVSLAHHGVLFLDELPEFDRRVLEALREPLESGRVSVARANQRAEYPASFLLVAAMNPCPCGRAGQVRPPCRCQPAQISRYRSRISGPLLDRIDLRLRLAAVDATTLTDTEVTTPLRMDTAQARALVCLARQRQQQRQGKLNARLEAGETLHYVRVDSEGLAVLRKAAAIRGHSARSQHRVLRVARSIADLEGRDQVIASDIGEALSMRWDE
ncbi:MAG: YifB family Mg chelatase-like AAA ATPase [Pseudomonadota bacterium]